MKRRNFLIGAASALGVGYPSDGAAQGMVNCQPAFHPAVGPFQQCRVGVHGLHMPPQKCPYWCWAACCEAIFAHAGIFVPQQVFVQKLFANPHVCSKATGKMIQAAVNGPWQAQNGQQVFAQLNIVMDAPPYGPSHPDPMQVVFNELNANRAVISGSLGHAVLIHAVDYSVGPGGYQVNMVHIRDPYPGNANYGTYNLKQFLNVNFLATLSVN